MVGQQPHFHSTAHVDKMPRGSARAQKPPEQYHQYVNKFAISIIQSLVLENLKEGSKRNHEKF